MMTGIALAGRAAAAGRGMGSSRSSSQREGEGGVPTTEGRQHRSGEQLTATDSVFTQHGFCNQCNWRDVGLVNATDGRFYCGACWGDFLIADARAQMALQPAASDRGASFVSDRTQRTRPQTRQPAAAVARARLASSGNRNVRGVFSASGQRATPPTRPRSRRVDAAANRPHGSDADSDSDRELPVVSLHAMDSRGDLRADLFGIRQELERRGGAELFGVRRELERIQHRIEGDSDGERASSVEADEASLDWESFAEYMHDQGYDSEEAARIYDDAEDSGSNGEADAADTANGAEPEDDAERREESSDTDSGDGGR